MKFIAEVGINHNGSYKKAKELTLMAIEAGADVIKYQYFKAETSTTSTASLPPQLAGSDENIIDNMRKYELSEIELKQLVDFCKEKGVLTSCSGDVRSDYDVMERCGIDIYKFGSDGIEKHDLIEYVATFKKPIIFSSGMSTIGDIESAVAIAKKYIDDISVLHCTSQYPTAFENINLNAMVTIMNQFPELEVGLSDHSQGVEVSIAASVLGAKIIEKHFIDSHQTENPDEPVSLDPKEFKYLKKSVRNVSLSLGSSQKKPTSFELEMKKSFRHSLVAGRDIEKGELFSLDNVTYKRPGTGLSPKYIDIFLGKRASKDIKKDTLFDWDII